MLAYAIFVTFVLGVLMGSVATVRVSTYMEKRSLARLLKDFDEAVEIATQPGTILTY